MQDGNTTKPDTAAYAATAPLPDVTAGEVTVPGYAAYLRQLWSTDPDRFTAEHPGVVEHLLSFLPDATLVRLAVKAAGG